MRSYLEDAADGGGAQVQPGAAEYLGNLVLSQGRTESLRDCDGQATLTVIAVR